MDTPWRVFVINLQWFARVSRLSNSFSGTQKRRMKRVRVGFAACHRWHRSAEGKGRVFFSNVGRMSCPQNPSEVFVCGIGQQMSGIVGGGGIGKPHDHEGTAECTF